MKTDVSRTIPWKRYSSYEIVTGGAGEKVIRPAEQSTGFLYSAMHAPMETAFAALALGSGDKADAEKRVLHFVNSFGLLEKGTPDLPKSYSEKVSDILEWAEGLYAFFSEQGEISRPERGASALKGEIEAYVERLKREGSLHECKTCGRFFYSREAAKRTCSERCEFDLKKRENMVAALAECGKTPLVPFVGD